MPLYLKLFMLVSHAQFWHMCELEEEMHLMFMRRQQGQVWLFTINAFVLEALAVWVWFQDDLLNDMHMASFAISLSARVWLIIAISASREKYFHWVKDMPQREATD